MVLSLLLVAAMFSGCGSQESKEQSATATAQGFGGKVTVTVTVKDGALVNVTAEGPDETEGVGSRAIEQLPGDMVKAGTVDVDGVAGATYSSDAVISAAKKAYAQLTGTAEELSVKMAPGTYTGSASGYRSAWTIDATVTVNESEIVSIDIAKDSADTVGVFDSAVNLLVPRIIENQSIAIDSITGATASSNGIKNAVKQALAAALAAGGSEEGSIEAFEKVPEKLTDAKTINTGVLVVGLGGAGTMAALRAAECMYADDAKSVDVLAIDKAGRYGGTSSLTADFFAVNPTKYKTEHNGGKDYVDAEGLLADWLDYTRGDAKTDMVKLLLDNSGDTLDWMVYEHGLQLTDPSGGLTQGDDMVVKFKYAPSDKGLTVRRLSNLAFYDGCMKDYTDMGGKYMLETDAYDLIYDEKSKTVLGVKARGYDGTEYEIYADAVILATGGFAGSASMEEKYLSNEYYPLNGSWSQIGMTQCTGDMIQAAINIGAGTYNIGMSPIVHMCATPGFLTQFEYHVTDQFQSSTNKSLVWTEGDIPMYLGSTANSLAVSAQGKRFTNETGVAMVDSWKAGPTFYSIHSNAQIQELVDKGFKSPVAYGPSINFGAVGVIPDNTPLPNAFAVMDAAVEAGYAVKADTIEELAKQLGMDAAVLQKTVADYNGYCDTGVDEEFGKSADNLEKIGDGPYYAIVMRPYCYSTCGALNVDSQLRVLGADGVTPIKGLYAAGLDSSGVLFSEQDAYVTYGGVAQGWAYTSGKLAGEAAYKNLAGKN